MSNYNELSQCVIKGMVAKAEDLTKQLVDVGEKPLDIIRQGLIAGMEVVGQRFKNSEMFIPEVLMSARAMDSGLAIVKPLLAAGDMPNMGKIVIGTVKGDLHDIGKNLVAMMLESAGFEVINAGVDVKPEKFVELAKEHDCHIIGMSAMLTTTMLSMKDTINLLDKEGLRGKVKVIIGGAPVSQVYADEVEADGYSADAVEAVDLCKKLLNIA